jgi:cyclopropane fatty-acyl-phospholipid synthase-like methyltransferase
MIDLPYFDLILEGREKKDALAAAFSSYVHWGYWDEPGKARGDDGDFAVAMEKLNGEVLAEARLSDGQAVVDCGCGFGGTLGAIAAQKKNMKLTGVNVDARQLAVAKSQVRGGVTWVEADACALPFPDKSFDRALAV